MVWTVFSDSSNVLIFTSSAASSLTSFLHFFFEFVKYFSKKRKKGNCFI